MTSSSSADRPAPSLIRFQQRVIFPFIALLAFLLAALSWGTLRALSKILDQELHRKGASAVQSLAQQSRFPLLLGDQESLQNLVRLARSSDPDYTTAAVLDGQGQMIATTDPSLLRRLRRLSPEAMDEPQSYAAGEGPVFIAPVPGRTGRKIGVAAIEISIQRVARTLRASAARMIAATLVVFLIIAALLNWLLSRIKTLADREIRRAADLEKAYKELQQLQSRLVRAEKMSAVGQLAAGAAHEINNPLGIILGFAQAAVRRLQPGDTLEMPLKSIEKEAMRCRDLVQDLLVFSRVSKVEREPLDFNRTIEGALSLVMAQARIAHIEVRKELAPALPRILGNSNQIQQVIVNLANNAFDAMGDRGILTVRTELLADGPLSWIGLGVADTGPGIPTEIQSRIFEPFFTTKPVGKGTGLGLSLIHEIVKKHSGTIDIESRPGHTEFLIKLPVRSTPPR